MNTQKVKTVSVIATLAIAVAALTIGLSQIQPTTAQVAPPQGNNVYVFAEGVNPQVTFTFGDKVETVDFQLFNQIQGFENNGRGTSPEFTLVKVAGTTPYLSAAVNEVHSQGIDSRQNGNYFNFKADVALIQAGKPVRTFSYNDCNFVNYKVDTRTDNEEGYTTGGKTGFAVVETYTVDCSGYSLGNPAMDELIAEQQANPYK